MAEKLAAHHMKGLGFKDARVTPGGADAGVDVTATGAAAQVKNYAVPVGRPDIQRFLGASRAAGAQLFYSLSGYSGAAIIEANDASVALFRFSPKGVVEPLNARARELTESPPAQGAERQRRLHEHIKENPLPGGYSESWRDLEAVRLRLMAIFLSRKELTALVADDAESIARQNRAYEGTVLGANKLTELIQLQKELPRAGPMS